MKEVSLSEYDKELISSAATYIETGSYLLKPVNICIRYYIGEIQRINNLISEDISLTNYEAAIRNYYLFCTDPDYPDYQDIKFTYDIPDECISKFELAGMSDNKNMIADSEEIMREYDIPVGTYLHLVRSI